MRSMAQQTDVKLGGGPAQPGSKPANEAPIDLRRRSARRSLPSSFAQRTDYLPPDEAALLRSVYHDGVTIAAIAAMAGVTHATIRSRLRRILHRLDDPCFAFVLAHRAAWPPPMARVAPACFLHGHPLRRTAADLNMSIAAVRRYRDAVAALCEAQRQSRTGAVA